MWSGNAKVKGGWKSLDSNSSCEKKINLRRLYISWEIFIFHNKEQKKESLVTATVKLNLKKKLNKS